MSERVQRAKQLFITALFSSIIFVTNFFVPPPINNLLIVVQAVILALASFFVGKAGATYVGLVGGVLSALSRPAFGPFTFAFSLLYGLLVDGFFMAFGIAAPNDEVSRNRVMLAMAVSTAIIGMATYYTFAATHEHIARGRNVRGDDAFPWRRKWHNGWLRRRLPLEQVPKKRQTLTQCLDMSVGLRH